MHEPKEEKNTHNIITAGHFQWKMNEKKEYPKQFLSIFSPFWIEKNKWKTISVQTVIGATECRLISLRTEFDFNFVKRERFSWFLLFFKTGANQRGVRLKDPSPAELTECNENVKSYNWPRSERFDSFEKKDGKFSINFHNKIWQSKINLKISLSLSKINTYNT